MPRFSKRGLVTQVSALADRPTPRPYRGNVKDPASKQRESSPIWVQLKLQSPDGKYYRNRFSQTPKATPYGPEPRNIPAHAPDRTQLQDGSFGRWQAGACKFHGNAKARPFRYAGVPGRPERFWRRHPKAHPDYRTTRSKDPGLERFVRLGGTSVLDFDPVMCSLPTEPIAQNS